MKRITYKILIFVFTVLTLSCNDYMSILPPEGLVRDQFWNTKEEVEQVVLGAYTTFAQLDGVLFRVGEMRADMVADLKNLSLDDLKIIEGNIYADNPLCNWQQFYMVINFCNEVIKNGPVVKDKDATFTDFQLKGYLSEVYFLRSLSYFYLVRIFKDVPYVSEPTETDDSNFYLPKTDGDSILNFVMKDLKEYRKYATIDGFKTIAENHGRATKAAFDALMADISLWQFKYEDCIQYVQNIENSNKYELMPQDKWFEIFYPGNSLEGIFEFQFDPSNGESNKTYDLTNTFSYNYGPSKKAIDLFNKETLPQEKIRGENNSIKRNGTNDFSIWKYIGRTGDGITTRSGLEQKGCNWILYRLADVMLMKAEALSQLDNTQGYTEALEILQKLHERAGFTDKIIINNSTIAFEDRIMEERLLELAFEGKRWFDVMRMGRRNNFNRKSKLIDIVVQNASSTQKRILSIKLTNPLGWYLPISKSELERNKNLVQNPYYKTNF